MADLINSKVESNSFFNNSFVTIIICSSVNLDESGILIISSISIV